MNPSPLFPVANATSKPARSAPSTDRLSSSGSSVTYDKSEKVLRFAEVFEDHRLVLARTTLQLKSTRPRGAVAADGTVAADGAKAADAAMVEMRAATNDSALARLANYVAPLPPVNAAIIRDFVADAITLTLPQTVYTVEALVGPVTLFVYWAVFVVGCDQDAHIIFDRDLIESYVRDELPATHSDGTRRNHRAWITRVAEAVNPNKNPRAPMPLNARSMKTPYTEKEVIALNRWSAGQRTAYLRSNAAVLVALGMGAGLTSIEIAQLTGNAVTVHDDGMVEINVIVKGEFKRRIVVINTFESILTEHLTTVKPDAFVFLPQRTRTENDVVSAFVARTSRPKGTPHVSVQKMRNSWFVTHMTNRVDVLTLMEAAGLQSLETISKLAIFVPRPHTTDRDAQLRGAL
jgi:hypothetical protein